MREISNPVDTQLIDLRIATFPIQEKLADCSIYVCNSDKEFNQILQVESPTWTIATHHLGSIYLKPIDTWIEETGSIESILLHEFAHFVAWRHAHNFSVWQNEALAMLLAQQYECCAYVDVDSPCLSMLSATDMNLYKTVGRVVYELVHCVGEWDAWSYLWSSSSLELEQIHTIEEVRSFL